jgi:CRP-like cAMP-binding protein
MFPGSCFRLAYDELKWRHTQQVAAREYLKILAMAAKESETAVMAALAELCGRQPITAQAVEELVRAQQLPTPVTDIGIATVDLANYDCLLSVQEVAYAM